MLTDLQVERPLHPWNKSHLIMLYDPFNVLLYLICSFFIEEFLYLCSSMILACDFSFLCVVLVLFWYQGNEPYMNRGIRRVMKGPFIKCKEFRCRRP